MGFLAMRASSFMSMKLLNSVKKSMVRLLSPSKVVGGIPSNRPLLFMGVSSSISASVKGSSPVPRGGFLPRPRTVCEDRGLVGRPELSSSSVSGSGSGDGSLGMCPNTRVTPMGSLVVASCSISRPSSGQFLSCSEARASRWPSKPSCRFRISNHTP